MKFQFTKDQIETFLADEWIDADLGDYDFYIELDSDMNISYFEMTHKSDGKTKQGYAFSSSDLDRLYEKKPEDPSWYRNEPRCPRCGAYLLYKYEFCPKCGQKLDWSERYE